MTFPPLTRNPLVSAILALLATAAHAAETPPQTVEITGNAPLGGPAVEQGFSGSSASAAAISALGGPAQSSPYRALDLMPSVNLSGPDAHGLSVDQSFLRIRGLSAYTYSNLAVTVLGVPSSVNVGNGGMGNLFDLENLSSVTLQRGPMPASQGLGFGNLAGAMDLGLRAPAETFGASVKLSSGSDHLHKLFARIDGGRTEAGTRWFLSASDTAVDKWRGPGDQVRRNTTLGLTQPLGSALVELYAVHNRFQRHEYRALSYAQSQDPSRYTAVEYNAVLTGKPAQDALWADYNRQQFTEDNLIARVSWALADGATLRISPYWLKTTGYRLAASGSNVMKVDIAQDQAGVVAELAGRWAGHDWRTGLWLQRIATMPPPLGQKLYTPDATGHLVFSRWSVLAEMPRRQYASPWLQLAGGQPDGLRYSAGLRWLGFTVPGITTFQTTGLKDVDRDTALASSPGVNAALSTGERRFATLLPSASLQHRLAPGLEGRLAVGRNVGNPWLGPLYSAYQNNLAKFSAAGVSLQSLWNSLQLETADTLDAGLRWQHGALTLSPGLYVSRIRHKQVTAYDPAVGVSYLQNGTRAQAWGAELEAQWAAARGLDLLASASWNVNRLDDDIRTGAGSVLATRGKQVPDAPEWLLKLAAEARLGAWRVTPVLRHVGARWGDALNTERVAAYTTADLGARLALGRVGPLSSVELGASALNLFNRRYIGSINAGQDDARPGAITYFPGAARSLSLSLSASL